jgi:hypothetical protein
MRAAIMSFFRWVTLAVVAGVSGLTQAWAACPASPSYSPDFTANQSCLSLNGVTGSPSFVLPQTPEPNVANVLRLTANQGGWATSAWYQTPQPVTNGFSTTFSFQLGNSSSSTSADGIAFVIQNSSLMALGPTGCGIGFGGSTSCGAGGGIPKSLAIEFNTFDNGATVDPNGNDVAIQSCGTSPNLVDVTSNCSLAHNPLTNLSKDISLADGSVHVATITYAPTGASNCGAGGSATCYALDVILDGVDLFPGGVPFDITTIGTTSTAYVGFTAATGGDNDEQDIPSWTFNPQGQSGSGTVNPGQTTTYDFSGGFQEGNPNSGYNFSATPSSQPNPNTEVVVTAIPISQQSCNGLIGNFAPAKCFSYQNGGGQGNDTSVLFEVTCPPNGSCGSMTDQFNAQLATQFSFICGENVPLVCPATSSATSGGSFGLPNLSSLTGFPEVGLLKGEGPDPLHPCTPNANPAIALFQSNQIDAFELGDTSGGAHGGSGGTMSCWVVTYETPGELPTITITQPANGAFYQQGSVTAANFSCNAVNAGAASPVGPYLTVSTCTGSDAPGGAVANGAQFDSATLGPHTFTVQVQDSAINTNQQSVNYTVVTGSAPASGTKCNGVYYGTFKGNITVVKGQSCTFVAGGVTGSIVVLGGSLTLTNASVGGGIGIAGGSYSIGPATSIRGDVAILATSPTALPNQVCGSSVGGSLTFLANASPVNIGSASGSCPGNSIGGSLVVDFNAAPTSIFNNTVGGSLLDQGNSKPTQVFNNHIKGNLTCQADSSITGGGNTATKKQGQCASF